VIGLEALAVLAILTFRHAWMWNFINYDLPVEYGVYAHGGPGVKIAMNQIDEISLRTAGEHTLKLAYDSDSSWPFSWYLRDYTNAAYVPNNPTREQLNVPVVIAGSASWSTFEPILGDRYDKYTYRLIWWPMEDYKGKSNKVLSWDEIRWTLTNPQMLKALWDIWLNRDYKLYDQVTGTTHTLDKWPLVHDFRLYVRKDISAQVWDQHVGPVVSAPPQVDPYLKGRKEIAGKTLGATAGPGSGPGQFNAPHGLAVAPDGTLYVADSNNHRIQKFDQNGQFVMAFGGFSGANNTNPAPGTFNEPWGVAIGPDGSVYVADTWNHRIQKFDSAGVFVKAWGQAGQTDINGQGNIFWGPRDLAVGKDGRVYVTDTGNKRIQVFDSEGTFITQFGGAGVQPGQLDEPVGIAIDPTTGNLVVADTWNQRIQVLTPEGQPMRQWDIKGWLDQSVTDKPYVAVDKNGNVYTTDPTGFRVLVFGSDGTFKLTFGDIGTDEKSFQLPIGIAVDDSGNVYVSDAGLGRIVRFAAEDLNIR
jgi:DNA-binding beta-propeller fold protein YncE